MCLRFAHPAPDGAWVQNTSQSIDCWRQFEKPEPRDVLILVIHVRQVLAATCIAPVKNKMGFKLI